MSRIFENTQKKLDQNKWFTSKIHDKDLSGCMWYCLKCEKRNCTHRCNATQKEREANTLCAKAYIKACRERK